MGGFTNAGFGGSNANAMGLGSGFGAGTSFAGWDSAQKNYFGGGGAGGSSTSSGGAGGNFGWNQAGVNSLLDQQMNENNTTKAGNEQRWQNGVNMLTGARDSYNNSGITAGNRNLVAGLQADPYTINDNTQALIQNKAAGTINANLNSQGDRMAGILAAGGQTDAGSMAAMQSQLGRQGIGQLANTQSQIEVQRALQNKQDIMNAIQAGQTQAGQDYGVNAGTANSYLQNNLYEKPMDLSGYIAKLGPMGGSGGGAASSTFSGGGGAAPASMAQYLQSRVGGGSGFNGGGTSTFNWGGGPDAYANAAGGGPGAATPNSNYYGGNGMTQTAYGTMDPSQGVGYSAAAGRSAFY